jgi:hypothetical protein
MRGNPGDGVLLTDTSNPSGLLGPSTGPQDSFAASGLVEHFFRREYGRLVAILTRKVGVRHVDLVEDAVQTALMTALTSWVAKGLPEDPGAWLYRVAHNHLIGALRNMRLLGLAKARHLFLRPRLPISRLAYLILRRLNLGISRFIRRFILLLPLLLNLGISSSQQRIFATGVDGSQYFEQQQQAQGDKPCDLKTLVPSSGSLDRIPTRQEGHSHNLLIAWGASLLLVWRLSRYTANGNSRRRPTNSSKDQA